jgi:hypothetical protein
MFALMNSEAASENPRGRGRPPRFPPEAMRWAAAQGPRTRHGQQDRLYAELAIHLIKQRYPEEDERRSWLFSEERKTARWSLLAELGRIRAQRGEEAFLHATEWITERRPKVKDGVRRLRSWRIGIPLREDSLELKLLRVLETYPEARAKEALDNVRLAYEASGERD